MKVVKHGTEAVFHKNDSNMLVKCGPVFFCGAKKIFSFSSQAREGRGSHRKNPAWWLTSGVSRVFSSRTSLTVSPRYWVTLSSAISCTATVSWACISACHIEQRHAHWDEPFPHAQWRTNTERKYKRECYVKKNTCMNSFRFVAIDVFLFDENAWQGFKKVINLCALFTRWQTTINGFLRL